MVTQLINEFLCIYESQRLLSVHRPPLLLIPALSQLNPVVQPTFHASRSVSIYSDPRHAVCEICYRLEFLIPLNRLRSRLPYEARSE